MVLVRPVTDLKVVSNHVNQHNFNLNESFKIQFCNYYMKNIISKMHFWHWKPALNLFCQPWICFDIYNSAIIMNFKEMNRLKYNFVKIVVPNKYYFRNIFFYYQSGNKHWKFLTKNPPLPCSVEPWIWILTIWKRFPWYSYDSTKSNKSTPKYKCTSAWFFIFSFCFWWYCWNHW